MASNRTDARVLLPWPSTEKAAREWGFHDTSGPNWAVAREYWAGDDATKKRIEAEVGEVWPPRA